MFCAIQYVAIHSYIGFTALLILIIIHDKSTALAYAIIIINMSSLCIDSLWQWCFFKRLALRNFSTDNGVLIHLYPSCTLFASKLVTIESPVLCDFICCYCLLYLNVFQYNGSLFPTLDYALSY